MIRQAIIPLAGLGTRLLPLTTVFPKELLPINGKPAIDFEIAKRQVEAIGELASSTNSKTFVLPSEMTQVFSAAYTFLDSLPSKKEKLDNNTNPRNTSSRSVPKTGDT